MKFRSESLIHHPRDKVFAAYRDRLVEVVPYLDDIEAVVVRSRKEEGDTVTLHNEWRSGREVPSAAKAFLKPDQLAWDDYATWRGSDHTCHFDIKTRAFRDAVRCVGTNTFTETPSGGTKVVLEGDFEVALHGIPGVPSFLARTIIPQVEKFIIALIQPNLEKTNQAVERFLDAQGG